MYKIYLEKPPQSDHVQTTFFTLWMKSSSAVYILSWQTQRGKKDINFPLSLPCSALCILVPETWAWKGTKAADSSWRALIGWLHQTAAAVNWGMWCLTLIHFMLYYVVLFWCYWCLLLVTVVKTVSIYVQNNRKKSYKIQ